MVLKNKTKQNASMKIKTHLLLDLARTGKLNNCVRFLLKLKLLGCSSLWVPLSHVLVFSQEDSCWKEVLPHRKLSRHRH